MVSDMTAMMREWVDQILIVGPYVWYFLEITLRLVALVVVPRNRRPGSAFAWLMAIMLFPIIAFPVYLMLGNTRLPRKRREMQKEVMAVMRERAETIPDAIIDEDTPSWLQSAVNLNRELGAFPLTGNNSAELEIEYSRSIARMTDDILTAEEHVHVLFYTATMDEWTSEFFDALAAVQARGVKVRLLYDFVGSVFKGKHHRQMVKFCKDNGIEHYSMMPIRPFRDGAFQRPDLRNHRKLVIVDGQVGWAGSQNLIAPHYDSKKNIRRHLRWQETMARFEGPIVTEMNLLFGIDWYFESHETISEAELVREVVNTSGTYECQLVPSGPGFVQENNLLLFNQLFYSAERKIVAVSPYFVPEESMLQAMVTAAKRGVEVELFVSEVGDQFLVFHAQRSYYSALLEAGVKIWLYEAPFILHAKHVSIDESVAVIGSSNMDIRSFNLDMESSVMVGGADFMEKLHVVEQVYRDRSRELTSEEWESRSFGVKVLDNLCRLASAIV